MSVNLTAKQENFCKLIVAGKSQYDAYVGAFGNRKGPRNTIDRDASVLRATPKIGKRIADCVFRTIVTGRFGSVTAEFGNVTGHFGDVTAGPLAPA